MINPEVGETWVTDSGKAVIITDVTDTLITGNMTTAWGYIGVQWCRDGDLVPGEQSRCDLIFKQPDCVAL